MFCIVLVNVHECAGSSDNFKQFNHLAKSFGVISVLKPKQTVHLLLSLSSFVADEKAKFQLKPAQFLE